MGREPTAAERVQSHIVDEARTKFFDEIRSVVLTRMTNSGGRIAEIARFRSFVGEALGVFGTVSDIIDMAIAGYEAMTVERRMLMRVSAAHGFGYWMFQHQNVHNPRNPPNEFLVMHRENDDSDTRIGEEIGNANFSTDGGLTSYDWNIIWQEGVRSSQSTLERQMRSMMRNGSLQRALQERLTTSAGIHSQSYEQMANQYRFLILAPQLGSPAVAAGGFFLASLRGVNDLEKEMNLRLYRRFPYNPIGT